MRTVSFLEGALHTLKQVAQVTTFSEVIEFKEYIRMVERMLHEEERVQKKFMDQRNSTKENYNEYCSQMGKLKGFHYVIKSLDHGIEENEFTSVIKRRLKELFARLEDIDVKIVEAI